MKAAQAVGLEEKEEVKDSKRKKDTGRYAAMTEEEKELMQKKDAARYAPMTEEEKQST